MYKISNPCTKLSYTYNFLYIFVIIRKLLVLQKILVTLLHRLISNHMSLGHALWTKVYVHSTTHKLANENVLGVLWKLVLMVGDYLLIIISLSLIVFLMCWYRHGDLQIEIFHEFCTYLWCQIIYARHYKFITTQLHSSCRVETTWSINSW